MLEIRKWIHETRADEATKNLIRHGFEAINESQSLSAVDEVMKRVPPTKTVGVGGSVTLRELGLIEALKQRGNLLYDHWKEGIGREESLKIRKAQQGCDIYLTSANAVTLSGEIVNVDGFCNRISSMAFGPEEVILVAGKNKIVRDVSEGLARIKNRVAPMNARRFGADTPCARLGRCVDCDSPQRICRGTLILERRPFATKMLVILVMEDLGY